MSISILNESERVPMFPKNTWYVAATPEEIDEKPLGRKICGESIVFYRGEENKVAALEEWLSDRGIAAGETGFVGNDINDLACMARVGCGIAVADAHPSVLMAADLVLGRPGGHGAVRELAELVLASRAGA